jgi:hypothetical protein
LITRKFGWTKGRSANGSQTGVYHLLVRRRAESPLSFACGWKGTQDGKLEEPSRDYKCQRCYRWACRSFWVDATPAEWAEFFGAELPRAGGAS